ncbi:MAG: PAS domain-containing protein [Clostridia bacterium]|nr:PAS domain-containing protein [Clostridia bacterium]
MTRRIFLSMFLMGLLVLILCSFLFFGVRYAQIKNETYSALRQEASFAAAGVAEGGEKYLASLPDGNRITWISASGDVLFDSEFGTTVSNQKDFPEIGDALESGEGHATRKSVSGGEDTMYYAVRCADGTVLRLSMPIAALREAFVSVSPVLWIFIFVLIISGILAFRSSRQLIKPINELKLDDPDSSKIYPELAPLTERIVDQNLTIREQMDELAKKQHEFAALTDNMSEGFALTDKSGTVLSANTAAFRMIGECSEGDDLTASSDSAVSESVRAALDGVKTDRITDKGDRSYQLIVNPVSSRGRVTGAVVLVVDVTEREQRERLRREFSANVSHELKTPLTSISGFAELMMQDMVTPDKVKEFSSDIYRESGRLIALVDDIIKLSKLDELDSVPESADVDLYALSESSIESLRAAADNAEVTLKLEGEHATVRGVERFLDEIVSNLCDNAIKYNKKGGEVTVTVKDDPDAVRLTVRDTGIGIPYEHQDRVFERFYRVNKSHSKSVAGTGLGLSIVKHAAALHGAKISLDSKPGEGTAVTVTFEKK